MVVSPKFPALSGPLPVGITDIEWAHAFPAVGHPDRTNYKLATDVESLLVRVFYPADPEQVAQGKTTHPKWLSSSEAQGYGDFVRMPSLIAKPIMSAAFFGTKVPAHLHARLSPPIASQCPATLPVVVFSHGLGGCKSTYQYFCSDLASRGLVVLAVEHRDRSACISVESTAPNAASTRTFNYQRMSLDSPPPPEVVATRHAQVAHRVTEVMRTVDLAVRLQAGNVPDNWLAGAPSPSPFAGFKGRLDLDNLIMAGHSFGAATSIATLQDQHERESSSTSSPAPAEAKPRFMTGLLMDPWMMPIDFKRPVSVPVLISSSETFHWRANSHAMATFAKSITWICME
ncbi:platelet-activating factor acetylhydrolase [Catenaria anguillulae PL171]|uniref:1-alkyl-2-acetylglycerophosphocholine esterase n=1 Tax=Catenaria anguillulae PL171 TaxID=765915 RepID=A0A1Y2HDL1_9FUNG|nr:platelet-activating factor acetylhydrolase [Catenaria anguillulae PL171]